MILVDDHCHLMHELYKKDLDEVVERAKKAGSKAKMKTTWDAFAGYSV